MNTRRIALLVAVAASVLFATRGGIAGPSADEANRSAAADAKILSEIHEQQRGMQNLEYLSDNIGPRLTGSPQLKQANEWTRTCSRSTGWRMRTWNHGRFRMVGRERRARASIVSPAQHPLTIAAAGWSPKHAGGGARASRLFRREEEREFRNFHGS